MKIEILMDDDGDLGGWEHLVGFVSRGPKKKGGGVEHRGIDSTVINSLFLPPSVIIDGCSRCS